jgi:hypothetical protein
LGPSISELTLLNRGGSVNLEAMMTSLVTTLDLYCIS